MSVSSKLGALRRLEAVLVSRLVRQFSKQTPGKPTQVGDVSKGTRPTFSFQALKKDQVTTSSKKGEAARAEEAEPAKASNLLPPKPKDNSKTYVQPQRIAGNNKLAGDLNKLRAKAARPAEETNYATVSRLLSVKTRLELQETILPEFLDEIDRRFAALKPPESLEDEAEGSIPVSGTKGERGYLVSKEGHTTAIFTIDDHQELQKAVDSGSIKSLVNPMTVAVV